MIRAALQRPGRLRMRLTVVAAASALFVLVVLAALVLPSLQHNLEQSRVASLHASVRAAHPEQLLSPFGQAQPTPALLQGLAATLGVARITVFTADAFVLTPMADSGHGDIARGALDLVQQSANLRQDEERVANLPGGRTAVLAFAVSDQGVDGVVLVEAPLRDVQQQVSAVERRLVIGGALAFAAALVAGALAAEPLARRLARLRGAADAIAHGSFAEPIVDRKHDEIGELARSLEEMRVRLEALDRARATFIANASHELRTPLTALGGYLELLTEGGLTEAERGEFLDTMGEQVQRLTKLATDLLDLSRLDAGGITIARDELELGELAADCAREMQALAARRGSHVVVEPGAPAPARGDEGRVLQVLRVLVDNAVRHTPPGSTVTLRTETTPWGASVIVSDNGPGIPQELLERIFERFFRGPGRRRARHGPRARDRARAGRAHGRAPARLERKRRHALHARAAGAGGAGDGRLH